MHLPDVNVWLALTFDAHTHHAAAKAWFDGLPDDALCYFCRLTQQGFLRLATNKAVFAADGLTLAEAWQKYDLYFTDPRISFAGEPVLIEDHWRLFTQAQTFSPKVWNDAYLAAFALTGGFEVVTFDKAFTQFRGTKSHILA